MFIRQFVLQLPVFAGGLGLPMHFAVFRAGNL
jgi:hypothetical protein